MRVRCLHGYFIFDETRVGQLSDFQSLTGLLLEPVGDHFTFAALVETPDFTLQGKPFLGFTATKNFEGSPWELFEANGVVYDFSKNLIVPIASISQKTRISLAGNRFISPGLILPGSLTEEGKRVKDYAAWYLEQRGTWLYSEVSYV